MSLNCDQMEPPPEEQQRQQGVQRDLNAYRSMRDLLNPPRVSAPSCIIPSAEDVVVRPYLVPLLPTFHGMENENPYTDSCHSRGAGINNIYKPKFPPTAVAKLLQYSGSRIEHRDEFSSYQMIYSRLKMVNLFWILGFGVKTVRVLMMKTENKLK